MGMRWGGELEGLKGACPMITVQREEGRVSWGPTIHAPQAGTSPGSHETVVVVWQTSGGAGRDRPLPGTNSGESTCVRVSPGGQGRNSGESAGGRIVPSPSADELCRVRRRTNCAESASGRIVPSPPADELCRVHRRTSDESLLHHLAVGGHLVSDGFLIARHDDGHLVGVEVLLGDTLDLGRSDRVDAAHVGGEVVVAQAVQVNEAELAGQTGGARAAEHERTGEVVLDAADLVGGWCFVSQAIDLAEDLLQRCARDIRGNIGALSPYRGVDLRIDRTERRVRVTFLLADVARDA